MLESLRHALASQHLWGALFYLVVGAVLGAVVSIYISIRAQKPRLIISGGGSGGNQQGQRWSINIMNQPKFFGVPFAGETARDVHAWLRLRERDSSHYMLSWIGQGQQAHAAIEPGQSQSLELFSWIAGGKGYCVVDQSHEPVARFEAPELKFVLRLNDRLGRITEFPFTVKFDDTHLKNTPQLRILYPMSREQRLQMIRSAFHEFLMAFRLRQ